jgi:hypothetical protein
MDLKIAVIGIRFARQQGFKLFLLANLADALESRFGFGDDLVLAFGLAELDQLERLRDTIGESLNVGDRLFKLRALTQEILRTLLIVPEIGVPGERVQLLQS